MGKAKISRRLVTQAELPELKGAAVEGLAIRQLRKPLLAAFDIYKSNVYYGVITETENEHAAVLAWYQDLCDLQLAALENVPEKVKRYLK